MKKYSVVIISKNNRKKLLKAISSLEKNIDLNTTEVIVVEFCIENLSLPQYIKHIKIGKEEIGFSSQRNIGVRSAIGEWIIFVDDDIEVTEGWFNEITKKLPDNCFGAMGAVFPLKEKANLISFCIGILGHPGGGFRLHYFSKGNDIGLSQVATCNTIFKKYIIEEVGMFNVRNRFGSEDTDICLRIIEKYGENRFVYLPKALVWHDTHNNLFKALNWYIRRGKADINLFFINRGHIRYIFETSLLFKLIFFLVFSFLFNFYFFIFVFIWYFYQHYKYYFMVKYFEIYKFNNIYRFLIFILFPIIKFLIDLSFDLGRIIGFFILKYEKN